MHLKNSEWESPIPSRLDTIELCSVWNSDKKCLLLFLLKIMRHGETLLRKRSRLIHPPRQRALTDFTDTTRDSPHGVNANILAKVDSHLRGVPTTRVISFWHRHY